MCARPWVQSPILPKWDGVGVGLSGRLMEVLVAAASGLGKPLTCSSLTFPRGRLLPRFPPAQSGCRHDVDHPRRHSQGVAVTISAIVFRIFIELGDRIVRRRPENLPEMSWSLLF